MSDDPRPLRHIWYRRAHLPIRVDGRGKQRVMGALLFLVVLSLLGITGAICWYVGHSFGYAKGYADRQTEEWRQGFQNR